MSTYKKPDFIHVSGKQDLTSIIYGDSHSSKITMGSFKGATKLKNEPQVMTFVQMADRVMVIDPRGFRVHVKIGDFIKSMFLAPNATLSEPCVWVYVGKMIPFPVSKLSILDDDWYSAADIRKDASKFPPGTVLVHQNANFIRRMVKLGDKRFIDFSSIDSLIKTNKCIVKTNHSYYNLFLIEYADGTFSVSDHMYFSGFFKKDGFNPNFENLVPKTISTGNSLITSQDSQHLTLTSQFVVDHDDISDYLNNGLVDPNLVCYLKHKVPPVNAFPGYHYSFTVFNKVIIDSQRYCMENNAMELHVFRLDTR